MMRATQQIELKSAAELKIMAAAGHMLAEIRGRIADHVKPGVTTRELDRLGRQWIEDKKATPAFLGYQGFPATLCMSPNDAIVHGIPNEAPLEEGDILSVDFGLIWDGFYVDTATTVPVGKIDEESRRLIEVTEGALAEGIPHLKPGTRMGDYSAAVQAYVETRGFSVVREYAGHGIGRRLHEDPRIPNHGTAGKGLRWRVGMVVAVEPMVNMGTHKTRTLDDRWTVVTADGRRSAHAEHTVAITDRGPRILT